MNEDEGVRLSDEQMRQRRLRSIAIGLILAGLVVLFYAVTLVRIGGNIANGSPIGDTPPALIALDAEAEILGQAGHRRMPVAALYSNDGMRPLVLGHAEIISAIIVPPPPPRSGWGYHKSTVRGGLEFAMVVMAAPAT